MRLLHNELCINIKFQEDRIQELIVENPRILSSVIHSLKNQCLGSDGDWVLSDDDSPISIKKYVSLILDPFSLDCNNKRILSKIYLDLEKHGNNNYSELRADFNVALMNYLEQVCFESDIPLVYDEEIQFQDILKLAGVRVDQNAENLLETIVNVMRLECALLGVKLFVFVNLKSFLDKEDLTLLYQECFYKKINILLIESKLSNKMIDEEISLLDNDCCFISF